MYARAREKIPVKQNPTPDESNLSPALFVITLALILAALILFASCAHRATPPPCAEDGPDTSRKFHPLCTGPNFGPYP